MGGEDSFLQEVIMRTNKNREDGNILIFTRSDLESKILNAHLINKGFYYRKSTQALRIASAGLPCIIYFKRDWGGLLSSEQNDKECDVRPAEPFGRATDDAIKYQSWLQNNKLSAIKNSHLNITLRSKFSAAGDRGLLSHICHYLRSCPFC